MLRSHANYAVESERSVLGRATTSAAVVLEQSGPSIPRVPLVDVGNLPSHGAGLLLQMSEVSRNDSNRTVAQADSFDVFDRVAVDDNLLATSAHHSVLQEGMNDASNSPFRFFVEDDGSLLDPFRGPHAAQAAGAAREEHEDFIEPLEDEAEELDDSDPDDYTQFMQAEMLDRLYEYRQAYRLARRQRVAEARAVDLIDECGNLQHVRDTQEGLVQTAQEESDELRCNAENL